MRRADLITRYKSFMGLWIAVLFGAVQGLTEFLPVSSSGHLAILSMLALDGSDIVFTILLHLATFISVCVVYRKDIWALLAALFTFIPDKLAHRAHKDPDSVHMLGMIIITLLPLLLVLPVKSKIEAAFGSAVAIGILLIVTAALLFFANRRRGGIKTTATMTWRDALIIGFAQLFAVMPGLSRSGTTLAAALFCGMERENAVKYSFVISLPTILAAAVLELSDVTAVSSAMIAPYALGFLTAAVTGYLAIGLVRFISKKSKLWIFSIYCAALGAGLLISQLI